MRKYMFCPFCGSHDTRICNVRSQINNKQPTGRIWRRIECAQCKERFTTIESLSLTNEQKLKAQYINIEKQSNHVDQ